MISQLDIDKIKETLRDIRSHLVKRSSGLDSSGYVRDDFIPFSDNEDVLAGHIIDLSNIVEKIADSLKS